MLLRKTAFHVPFIIDGRKEQTHPLVPFLTLVFVFVLSRLLVSLAILNLAVPAFPLVVFWFYNPALFNDERYQLTNSVLLRQIITIKNNINHWTLNGSFPVESKS